MRISARPRDVSSFESHNLVEECSRSWLIPVVLLLAWCGRHRIPAPCGEEGSWRNSKAMQDRIRLAFGKDAIVSETRTQRAVPQAWREPGKLAIRRTAGSDKIEFASPFPLNHFKYDSQPLRLGAVDHFNKADPSRKVSAKIGHGRAVLRFRTAADTIDQRRLPAIRDRARRRLIFRFTTMPARFCRTP